MRDQVFFVNINTNTRVSLINLKQIHKDDSIRDIKQISKFTEAKKLKEITLHFELQQRNKHGGDEQLIYCQLKISDKAINLLTQSKGDIPNSYMHAFKNIEKLKNEN